MVAFMPDDTPSVTAITWVHDSTPTVVTLEDGRTLDRHRILVNNRQTAYLYPPNSTAPVAKLEHVSVSETDSGWDIIGHDPGGVVQVWAHPTVVQPFGGCGSCGG